jgi:anti-sigma regulatory factor (Ser/Thr protein kinase)/GAF domain-containing protein
MAAGGRTALSAARIDWDAYPAPVRTAVGLVLSAPFPAVVWFGGPTAWHQVHNDACHALLGDQHPLTAVAAGSPVEPAFRGLLDSVTETASSASVALPVAEPDGAAQRESSLVTVPVFAEDGTVCAVFGTINELAEPADRSLRLAGLRAALDAAGREPDVAAAFLRCPEACAAADAVALGTVVPDEGTLRILFVGDIPTEQRDRYFAVALDAPGPMAESVRTGRTVVVTDTTQGHAQHHSVLSDFAHVLGTLVFNPLRDQAGECIGALTLGWSRPRSFSPGELADLTAAVALAGPALARVRAVDEDRQAAAELQTLLLDLDRSSTTAAVAAAHRPAADSAGLGGHWYLAAPGATADRTALGVGEVPGQGLPATAAMSRLRTALAVAAASTDGPGAVLDVVSAHARTVRGAEGASVVHAVLDSATHSLEYACAGHLGPLLVGPDGRTEYLTGGRRPAPAAWSPGDPAGSAHAELAPGSLLVLFTTGLVARPGEAVDAGSARLARAAAECAVLPVGAVCAHLLDRMSGPEGFTDEVALLAVRPPGVTSHSFVQVMPATTEQAVELRHALGVWLEPHCADAQVRGGILISVGEALSNAVDHGTDPDRPATISIEAFLHPDGLATTVSDCGRWTGDSSASFRESVRGRGLKLIHAFSSRVETVRDGHGTRMTMHHALSRHPADAHA